MTLEICPAQIAWLTPRLHSRSELCLERDEFSTGKGNVVTNQTKIQVTLCQRLKHRRLELDKKLADIATKSGISVSYYCEIENGRSTPPPTSRMEKILSALEFCETETYELLQLSSILRGLVYGESELPPDIQALIRDIRLHANQLTPRFIKGLRTTIREVVS